VFRALIWTLRQRRYAALAATGLIVALICAGMGTFEIHRYQQKRHDNGALRDNAHAPATSLTPSLVPLTGGGAAPDANAIRYRHVSVSGRYLPGRQQYVANQTQSGRQGFYVLTPLRTSGVTLLVVRGFVAATSSETRPAQVAPPPAGDVHVTGWLQTPQTASDQFGRLGHGEIMSINPGEQVGRLHTLFYQASLTLAAHQPGTGGLHLVSLPGLGNPTGGAEEWQLLSYVIQWYAFALLALAMPFMVSRAEVRDARHRFLGIDPGTAQLDADEVPRELAGAGAQPGGALVARGSGEIAQHAQFAHRMERAKRLADRYGRSLGIDPEGALAASSAEAAPGATRPVVRDSSAAVHRSEDAYHASYNDYLWELALADGGLPNVFGKSDPPLLETVSEQDDDPAPGGDAPVP
jgi:cytochrome oxidase assembly protein ShyY1